MMPRTPSPLTGRGRPAERGALTRAQVARQLGVALATVHRLRVAGVLTAKPAADGVTWLYDPGSVLRYMASLAKGAATAGEIHGRAFEMFSAGRDVRDVVIELRQPVDVVRQLYREWMAGDEPAEAEPERPAPHVPDVEPPPDDAAILAAFRGEGSPPKRRKKRP